jgi:unsaturated rhamnogalacturonyl hydrolase
MKYDSVIKRFFVLTSITFCLSSVLIFPQSNKNGDWSLRLTENFINLLPDTIVYKTEAKSYKWNYEQGLILEAFFRMWKVTGENKYFNYLRKNIDYYVREDGSIKTYKMDDFNIDNIPSGRQLLNLYKETGEEKYRKAADTLRRQLELHPRTSEGGFWHKKIYPYQMWLDGLYMGEPFYTQYSVMFDKPEAFDDVVKQFLLIEKHLKDEKTGLYFHGWDESKEQKWANPETGTSPNFWGRAMGWFMMAIVDVLDYFPQDHPNRDDLIRILQNLSESLIQFRDDKTGLWYQVVDKGNKEGNYIEASASAMYTYAFAKGFNKGYLDKKYFDIAKESFQSIIKNLVTIKSDSSIYLNNVCSVGGLGGNPYRDGSFEYYISEPKRVNDFKGYGPLMLASFELENSHHSYGLKSSERGSKNKTVTLDYYFNNEWKDGKRFHYTWEDTTYSGFSDLGKIIQGLDAEITSLTSAPTKESLSKSGIYIIVDPDTPKETEKPNYIDEKSIKVISDWVNDGGILVLLANDSGNCEFENLNKLSGKFGINFNEVSENRVTGNNFDMGKLDNFPPHPVFKDVKQIYLKEISTLKLSGETKPILQNNDKIVMALAKYGKGYLFAVGDPWLYNEYIDSRKLPTGFENFKAAKNLFKWLLNDLHF